MQPLSSFCESISGGIGFGTRSDCTEVGLKRGEIADSYLTPENGRECTLYLSKYTALLFPSDPFETYLHRW